jgi:hypothetical protein
VLGTPVTTYKDIVSLKLSSMPASALPKNALGVRADPKGQVLLTPHTPKPHQKGAEKLISAEDAAQVAEAVAASAPRLVESGSSSQFWLAP